MATSQPQRILIVSHYYPPHHGGIERVAENQARRLAARGYEVSVVTSSVAADQVSGNFDGVRVVRVKAWNFLEKHAIPFPLFSPRLLSVLWRETGRADIVHIHDVFYLSSLAAAVCAGRRRRPIVLTQHVNLVPHPFAPITWIERAVYATSGAFIFRRSARVLVLNDAVEKFVTAYGVKPANVAFLPNGVDCELFHPATAAEKRAARRRFGLPPTRPVVLFVGRAVPKKGFDKVLAAQDDHYVLVFAGGKFSFADTAHTRFLGEVPPATMAEIFRSADVYVLPSQGEGFPLTVQEAMASGLAVVTTDDPGYARYEVPPAAAHLLKRPDAPAVRQALTELVQDKPRRQRMGTAARRYVQRFSWEQLTTQLITIYDAASAASREQA